MKTNQIIGTLMAAAVYVDREFHYNFAATEVPSSFHDEGCVLGWCAYILHETSLTEALQKMGYSDGMAFYDALSDVEAEGEPDWVGDAHVAASCMRRLAAKLYTDEIPDLTEARKAAARVAVASYARQLMAAPAALIDADDAVAEALSEGATVPRAAAAGMQMIDASVSRLASFAPTDSEENGHG